MSQRQSSRSLYLKWRLYSLYLRAFKKPIAAGFKLTYKCNLRCIHCPFWSRNSEDSSTEKVIDILNKLKHVGVLGTILEGGEPFMRRDLHRIVDEARKRFYVGIVTNGTFPLEGVRSHILIVSIDGLEATHDKIRGKGVFRRAIRHIEQSNHRNIHTNTVINSINQGEIDDLVEFFSQKVKGLSFMFYYPYKSTGPDLLLSKDKRASIVNRLISLKKEGLPIDNSFSSLKAMKDNSWPCYDWLVANVEPDGAIIPGCYLRGRGEQHCENCGFACYCEASLALTREDALWAWLNLAGIQSRIDQSQQRHLIPRA